MIRTPQAISRPSLPRYGWGLLVAVLIVWAPGPQASAQVEERFNLQPKFVTGQSSQYEYWSKRQMQVTVEAAGNRRDATTVIEAAGQVTWAVQRVRPDGSAVVEMTYDWITIDMTDAEGQIQQNDSRQGSGETPLIHELLKAIVDVPLVVEVAADGQVESVTGFAQAAQQLQNPQLMPEERDFMETARAIIGAPGAADHARLGATWVDSFAGSHQMGTMTRRTTWTFDGVEQIEGVDVAQISGESELTLEADRSQIPENGPDVDFRLVDAESSVQLMFELPARQTIGRNTLTRTTIVVTMSMGGQTLTQTLAETDHEQLWLLDSEKQ